MSEEFAEVLRSLRRDKDMSQRELAKRAAVHYTYISKLETGKEHPSQEMVRGLAAGLGAESRRLELAAGYVPREYAKAILEKKDLQRLLELAAAGRLKEPFYRGLAQLIARHNVVNVPVWLE